MSVDYYTFVNHQRPTPMGLIPECWKVVHRCSRCHQEVERDQLIAHTAQHQKEAPVDT
jgi:hypothetical protein